MKRKQRKEKNVNGEEIERLPLPNGFKGDVIEPTDKELPPRMNHLIQNFKLLCNKDVFTEEDFIKVLPVADEKDSGIKLNSGLTEKDSYMKVGANGCVETTIKSYEVDKEDYSGAAKAVIAPPISKRKAKKMIKEEEEKTKGKGWFDMKAPEMTEELKNDLELLQMRGALDPTRFYKKSDQKALPKYFAVGTVVDSPYDYYSDRIPMKQRKRTMVDELLADAAFKKYNKRKYVEIIESKQRGQRVSGAKRKKN